MYISNGRHHQRLRLGPVDPAVGGHGMHQSGSRASAVSRDGRRTRLEARAASWPQAASMSVPRLRRTVALTPRSVELVAKRAAPGRPACPAPGSPGVGLSGIRLTWAPSGRARAASSSASRAAVVDPVDQRPLEAQPPALGRQVLPAASSRTASG